MTRYRFFDANTGEEISPSDGFSFLKTPDDGHILHDADLVERFGGPVVVSRTETAGSEVKVFVEATGEVMFTPDTEE